MHFSVLPTTEKSILLLKQVFIIFHNSPPKMPLILVENFTVNLNRFFNIALNLTSMIRYVEWFSLIYLYQPNIDFYFSSIQIIGAMMLIFHGVLKETSVLRSFFWWRQVNEFGILFLCSLLLLGYPVEDLLIGL